MKLIKIEENTNYEIEVGDLVSHNNELCLLVKNKEWSGLNYPKFPYLVINIKSGIEINAYKNLEAVRLSCSLVCKNKDIELHY